MRQSPLFSVSFAIQGHVHSPCTTTLLDRTLHVFTIAEGDHQPRVTENSEKARLLVVTLYRPPTLLPLKLPRPGRAFGGSVGSSVSTPRRIHHACYNKVIHRLNRSGVG